MASLERFVRSLRASFSSASPPNASPYPRSKLVVGKYYQSKTWVRGLEHGKQAHEWKFQFNLFQSNVNQIGEKNLVGLKKLIGQKSIIGSKQLIEWKNIIGPKNFIQNLIYSGSPWIFFFSRKMVQGSFLGLSFLLGVMELFPARVSAMNGRNTLAGEHHASFPDVSDYLEEENSNSFWTWARKSWFSILLALMVVMGWKHPLTLAIQVALLLFSTKPNPLSVYLFIEQLRQQSIYQDPSPYKLKAFHLKKVEIEVDVADYKLLCLARAELRDRKLTLLGILGNWWVLQSSPHIGVVPVIGQWNL